MRLSESVRAVVRTFRRRPADLLPLYVLGGAIPTISSVATIAGLAIVYLHLETAGRLEAFREALTTFDWEPPDPEAEPEAFADWVEVELAPVLDPLVSPTVIGVLTISILLTVLVSILLYAGLTGGQFAACHARLRGERGLRAGIAGVRRYWPSILGVYVLEFGIWIAVTVGLSIVAGIAGGVATATTGEPAIGVLVGFALAILWLVTVLLVRAVFAFAPVAVVVDEVRAFESVSNAARFVRSQPTEAIFYYVLTILSIALFGVLLAVFSVFRVESLVPLLGLLVLAPLLDLTKTALYGDYRDTITPPPAHETSPTNQLSAGLTRGWRELLAFVRETPALHAGVVAAAVVGFWMGWRMATPYDGLVETSIAARLEGHVPYTAATEFFANNWTVALTTAYAGAVLTIPALVSIWFNGLVFGIYARLEADLAELVAFVAPHGLLEIPAIIVAGALGVHLGLVGWRTIRGRLERATLADELERAFWVLVGIALVLAVAAIVEGFVSPYYYRYLQFL